MSLDQDNMIGSAELRRSLRIYGERLLAILDELGIASPMGYRIPRELHQHATLRTDGREAALDPHDAMNTDREFAEPENTPSPSIIDEKALDDWMSEDSHQRLLIVASAGMGKSVLLETFAHRMAGQLIESLRKTDGESTRVRAVPVLVPLRKLEQNQMSLKEAILRSEALLNAPDGTGHSSPALSRSQMEELLERKLIVPLLDGFDELDDRHRLSLADSWNVYRRFALTSRPEHGAEREFDPSRHRTLEPLSASQVQAYVEKFFRKRLLDHADIGRWLKAAIEGPLGPMLTAPLFLRLWCEVVDRDKTPPAHLSDLTDELFERLLERRDVPKRTGPQGNRRSQLWLDSARDWFEQYLGELGVTCAGEAFGSRPLNDPKLPKREPDSPILVEVKPPDGIEMAEQAGVLVRLPGKKIRLLKLPVVEAVIAKHLVQMTTTPDGRRQFIGIFRRWVWMPTLHDILETAFGQLREGTEDQKSLALGSHAWLLKIATTCPLHIVPAAPPSQTSQLPVRDDLLRPFALLALRLVAPDDSIPTVRALVAARIRADRRNPMANVPIIGRTRPSYVASVLTELMVSFRNGENHDIREQSVERIETAAGRVPEGEQAVEVINELLGALGREKDASLCSALAKAIRMVAGRIPEGEQAVEVINELLAALGREKDASLCSELMKAIHTAASRIPEGEQVLKIANTWIVALQQNEESTDVRRGLISAIAAAAGRLPASECAVDMIDQLIRVPKNADASLCSWLAEAIRTAAGRIPEGERAMKAINQWFRSLRSMGDTAVRVGFTWAIEGATGRLPESECVVEMANEWIGVLKDEKDTNVRNGLALAIQAVARRIPENERAVETIDQWIGALQGEKNANTRLGLADAIAGVADRLPESERIVKVINHAIDALRGEQDDDIYFTLTRAIWTAASCIPEDGQAIEAVKQWITSLQGEKNGDVRYELTHAIIGAVGRLHESERVVEIIDEWIASLKDEKNTKVRNGLMHAIQAAAHRISKSELAANAINQMIGVLKGEKYADVRDKLARAIRTVARRMQSGQASRAALDLIEFLVQEQDGGLRSVHKAIESLISKCDSTAAYRIHIRLAQHLSDNRMDENLRSGLNDIFWSTVPRLDMASAYRIAKELFEQGKDEDAIRVASWQPQLAVTLKDWDEHAQAYRYQIWHRNDEKLVLDSHELFVREFLDGLPDEPGSAATPEGLLDATAASQIPMQVAIAESEFLYERLRVKPGNFVEVLQEQPRRIDLDETLPCRLFAVLARARGNPVSKIRLLDSLWPGCERETKDLRSLANVVTSVRKWLRRKDVQLHAFVEIPAERYSSSYELRWIANEEKGMRK